MKALVFHEHGGPEKLRIEEFPEPELRPGDALIEVAATSLNGFDPMILTGSTGLKTPLPMIPCGDYAGRIAGFAPDTDSGRFAVGDRVCPFPFVLGEGMTGETRLGAACERVRIPVSNLIAIPDEVGDSEAAALPIAYGTAYHLMERGAVAAGDKVLILGATGGVGTGCVQLAKRRGAEVVVTGSAGWKLEKLRELGADHWIDSASEDFVEAVHARFGKPHMLRGGGVDVVVNYIGGDTWARSLRCLGRDGRMLTCGATAGFSPPTDIRFIWTYEQRIIGANGWTPPEQIAVLDLVARGELRPLLHAVRPLAEAARSLQELIDRRVVGKSILTPGSP